MKRWLAANLIVLGTLALAGVVWAVRLEGRVDGHEKQIPKIEQASKEAIEQVRDDLRYIRQRLDQVLDGAR